MSDRAESFLGFTFKDRVTGFTGVATGYVRYLSGCNQVLLMPPVDKDGKNVDWAWIDEQRCDPVRKVKRVVLDNGNSPGFDAPAPKR